jgi:hypothetical protein
LATLEAEVVLSLVDAEIAAAAAAVVEAGVIRMMKGEARESQ